MILPRFRKENWSGTGKGKTDGEGRYGRCYLISPRRVGFACACELPERHEYHVNAVTDSKGEGGWWGGRPLFASDFFFSKSAFPVKNADRTSCAFAIKYDDANDTLPSARLPLFKISGSATHCANGMARWHACREVENVDAHDMFRAGELAVANIYRVAQKRKPLWGIIIKSY